MIHFENSPTNQEDNLSTEAKKRALEMEQVNRLAENAIDPEIRQLMIEKADKINAMLNELENKRELDQEKVMAELQKINQEINDKTFREIGDMIKELESSQQKKVIGDLLRGKIGTLLEVVGSSQRVRAAALGMVLIIGSNGVAQGQNLGVEWYISSSGVTIKTKFLAEKNEQSAQKDYTKNNQQSPKTGGYFGSKKHKIEQKQMVEEAQNYLKTITFLNKILKAYSGNVNENFLVKLLDGKEMTIKDMRKYRLETVRKLNKLIEINPWLKKYLNKTF